MCYNFLMKCTLCPVKCGADRERTAGRCGVRGPVVANFSLHRYEEPPICHTNGAGAVFFSGCSLRCVFCQNYEISHAERGRAVSAEELAEIFSRLEEMGADCLDLVTPDHVWDSVAEALEIHHPKIPVVFNSGGYCTEEAVSALMEKVDVWMPDLKFADPALSERYTGRRDYFEVASRALSLMAKKPLLRGERGELASGILVRHLVLPGCTSDSLRVLDFLKDILPSDAPLSVMRQYTPMGVSEYPELGRTVTAREYRRVVDYAAQLGFSEIYTQGKESASKKFIPKWDL